MLVARLNVTATEIKVERIMPLTAGMVGAEVEVTFDSTWDGYSKTYIWARGCLVKDDTTASGVIPAEVLARCGGVLRFGVYGTKEGHALPTLWASVGTVNVSADPSGDYSTNPTLPVWAQLNEELEKLGSEFAGLRLDWMPYIDVVQTELLPETVTSGGIIDGLTQDMLRTAKTATVTYDGTAYQCAPAYVQGLTCLGNLSYLNPELADTGEPFTIIPYGGSDRMYLFNSVTGEHTVAITAEVCEYNTLPAGFLTESYTMPTDLATALKPEEVAVAKQTLRDRGQVFATYNGNKGVVLAADYDGDKNYILFSWKTHLYIMDNWYAETTTVQEVTLAGDCIPVPTRANVGQTIAVKAVDDNGKPTEWETVDFPDSSQNANGGGLTTTAANLLIEILQSAVYVANVSGKIDSLKEALASGGSGSGDSGGDSGTETPDEPEDPVVTDDITVTDGVMTIISVGSEITVSDGVMRIA